jgi:hypothetical protein
MHFVSSTTRAFVGGFTTIASLGHASAHGTGWGHCLHASWVINPFPQFPCPFCPTKAPFGPKFMFRATFTRAIDGFAFPSLNSVHANSHRRHATHFVGSAITKPSA